MSDLVGGCLCGKIRYASKAAPVMTALCHCKNCQKQAGTAFSVVVAVPKSALSVTGTLKTFNDTGSSGKPVRRNFCPDCGSPITTEVEAMPDLVFIKAGTLDDTSTLAPTMEIFCSSTQPWTTRGVQMQKFAGAPGLGGETKGRHAMIEVNRRRVLRGVATAGALVAASGSAGMFGAARAQSARKTFVLVHGAWAGGWVWR